jgi:hypothetical protein
MLDVLFGSFQQPGVDLEMSLRTMATKQLRSHSCRPTVSATSTFKSDTSVTWSSTNPRRRPIESHGQTTRPRWTFRALAQLHNTLERNRFGIVHCQSPCHSVVAPPYLVMYSCHVVLSPGWNPLLCHGGVSRLRTLLRLYDALLQPLLTHVGIRVLRMTWRRLCGRLLFCLGCNAAGEPKWISGDGVPATRQEVRHRTQLSMLWTRLRDVRPDNASTTSFQSIGNVQSMGNVHYIVPPAGKTVH